MCSYTDYFGNDKGRSSVHCILSLVKVFGVEESIVCMIMFENYAVMSCFSFKSLLFMKSLNAVESCMMEDIAEV
jgi:hypothetical protein